MARRLRVLEAIVKAADVEIFFSSWRHETFGGRAVQQARMLASAACVSRVHTAAAGGTAATAIAPRRLPAALFSDSAAQQVDPAAASAEGSTPAASSAAAAGASKRAEDADERAGEAGPRSQLSAAARVYDSLHEPHEVMAEAQRQFDAGEFSTSEFASAVRRLVDMAGKQELTRASRGAFAELLDMVLAAADSGALVLDGKGTSYAIWGSTKLRLPPASPHLDRLLPLAAEHVGTMRFNDVATTVWALGELALKPDGALVEALFRQAEAVSATMRASNNIALLAGTTRLQLGEPYTQLVAGWLGQEPQLFARQIGNLANVLPMAGVKPGDPLAQLVFTQAEGQARWMDLVALTNIFWAAAKIGAELQPATMVALLHRLGRLAKFNRGRLLPSILWSLGKLGYRTGDVHLSKELMEHLIRSQMKAVSKYLVDPSTTIKFLYAVHTLNARMSRTDLELCLRALQLQLRLADPHELMLLDRIFRKFEYFGASDVIGQVCKERGINLRQIENEHKNEHKKSLRQRAKAKPSQRSLEGPLHGQLEVEEVEEEQQQLEVTAAAEDEQRAATRGAGAPGASP